MELPIHAVDVAAVLCVLTFALHGYRLGFVQELLTFAGWLIGFGLSLRFMVPLARPLSRIFFVSIEAGGLMAFLLLFVLGVAPFWILGSQLAKRRTQRPKAGSLAHGAGALVGVAQGLALAAFLLFIGRASPVFPELGPKVDAAPLGSKLAAAGKQAIEVIRSIGRRSSPPPPSEPAPS